MNTPDSQEPQTCGAVDELDYAVWFECGLRPGHAGDHEATHYWENRPHGPLRPPKPAEPGRRSLADAYAQMGAQHLELALRGSPLLNHGGAWRVQPRDRPFTPVKPDTDATAKP